MKELAYRLLAALVFLAGAAMISYPLVSNYSYERDQQKLIERYDRIVLRQDAGAIDRHLEECQKYNHDLLDGGVVLTDPFDDTQLDPDTMPYAGLLNLLGDGVMGSLEYPGLTDRLTIYHGTRETELQRGIGHLQGTSLPVGGTGSHCVLSAHSGLSGKKLFTNLDRARVGDIFYLYVLNQTLAYRVDEINVVLPSDTSNLMINSGEDYVTLITCTPYGVNSHRLLVRGTRVPYEEAKTPPAEQRRRVGTWTAKYLKTLAAGLAVGALVLAAVSGFKRLLRKKRD